MKTITLILLLALICATSLARNLRQRNRRAENEDGAWGDEPAEGEDSWNNQEEEEEEEENSWGSRRSKRRPQHRHTVDDGNSEDSREDNRFGDDGNSEDSREDRRSRDDSGDDSRRTRRSRNNRNSEDSREERSSRNKSNRDDFPNTETETETSTEQSTKPAASSKSTESNSGSSGSGHLSSDTLASTDYDGDAKFKQQCLDIHNDERASLGIDAVTYNDDLAAAAKVWAEQLVEQRSLSHSPNRVHIGENVGYRTHEDDVDSTPLLLGSWLDEKKDFQNGNYPDISTSGSVHDVGHYSAMIWSTTKEIGCAVVNGGGRDYAVCQYSPSGNRQGKPVY